MPLPEVLHDLVQFGLFLLLGVPSWLLVNALFLQAPYFIDNTPEGASMSAILSILVQVGNIPSFLFVAWNGGRFSYASAIIATISIAVTSAVLLALFWNVTVSVYGHEFSLVVYILTVLSGLVGSLSVILLFPFTSLYPQRHNTSAVSTGMGLTGLIASAIAIGQNTGPNQRFSLEVAFFIMAACLAASLTAFFVVLAAFPPPKSQNLNDYMHLDPSEAPASPNAPGCDSGVHCTCMDTKSSSPTLEVLLECKSLLLHQLVANICFYLVLAALPFAFLGAPSSTRLFLWATVCGFSLGSVGRLFTYFTVLQRVPFLSLAVVGMFLYLLVASFLGGHVGTNTSVGVISIIVFSLFSFSFGYENTCLFVHVKTAVSPELSERAVRYMALTAQTGAAAGAVVGFILVEAGAFG
mmetsp:Transcript_6495/g.16402  ORF Transcript_6495/g.16402 Transcript_6495/m.16402 type:complete len:410 (-) Transcript_6495:89-1318(-)